MFSCEGWRFDRFIKYQIGEYNIFRLPDYSYFDGVIVDFNSIKDLSTQKFIRQQLANAKIPYASFFSDANANVSVIMENQSSIHNIVEHLVKVHNVKEIHYISGTKHNIDATEREYAYISALKEFNLPFEESFISNGAFEYYGGKKDEEVGWQIYIRLKQAIEDKSFRAKDIMKGEMILGCSCGCIEKTQNADPLLVDQILEQQIYIDNNMDYLKSISIEFSNIDNFDYFRKELKAYVDLMNWDYFYLCLGGSEKQYFEEVECAASGNPIDRDTTKYTDSFTAPLAYEQGKWTQYGSFDRALLFPPDCKRPASGIYYIFMPIHHDDNCIGYCIVGNKEDCPAFRFIQHMVINVNNALGNIYHKQLMQQMFQRLNQKSIVDELTGLYNRFGLWENINHMIDTATTHKLSVAILFFDLDGLKSVNDIYGHEEGDQYIKSMAYILTKCFGKDDILVRYGGDEYIACTLVCKEIDIHKKIERIQKEIEHYNTLGLTQRLSTSIGYSYCNHIASIDISQMIEQADNAMYINKKAKKHQ